MKTKPSNLQLHKCTHFTQLYIAGNFPCLTDVVRISGREWVPTKTLNVANPCSKLLCTEVRETFMKQTLYVQDLNNKTASYSSSA